MSENTPAATAATPAATAASNKAPKPLKSKIGLQLIVIGQGVPTGATRQIETIRVKRIHDGGIRDIPRAELEEANGKPTVAKALAAIVPPLDQLASSPPPASD